MNSKDILVLSLVQADLVWENPTANRLHFQSLLKEECADADLIILPEMFTTGFTMHPEGKGEAMDGVTLRWMQEMSQELNAVLAGSLIITENGQYVNRLVCVDESGCVAYYDKRHLFRMAGEDKGYKAGTDPQIFTLFGWKICLQVCYDLRFPVWSRNRIKESGGGYDVMMYPANWPETRSAHWRALLRARAIENQAFVAGVNRVGKDGNGIKYAGDSVLFDPKGVQMNEYSAEELVITHKLNKTDLSAYRAKFPAWRDADDFHLLS